MTNRRPGWVSEALHPHFTLATRILIRDRAVTGREASNKVCNAWSTTLGGVVILYVTLVE